MTSEQTEQEWLYDEDTPQGWFDRHLKGVLKRKRGGWLRTSGPRLVKVESYETGHITDRVITAVGVDDHGEKHYLKVEKGGKGIVGYERV